MSKHTPGPWHVIERANGQAFSIGCQVQTKGNFITTHYIANITDRATLQAEADARLIAAAPQMLEALEACADYWHIKHNPGDEHGELLSLSAERAQRLIRVALAAAKGEV